jgi:hypothetical protein
MAAGTSQGSLVGCRHWKSQKFGQRGGPSVMHGRTHSPLDSLQIQTPCLAAGAEDDAQQSIYFARDFLLDRFGRFFSWADGWDSSTGRNWQTRSLTSNS